MWIACRHQEKRDGGWVHLLQKSLKHDSSSCAYYRPFNCCARRVYCLISCKLWSIAWKETCLTSQLMRWSCWRPELWKLRGFQKAVRFGLCRWQQDESLKMLGIHSQRWNDCKQMHSRRVQLFRRSKTHAFCRPWQLLCILRSCIHMVFQDQEYVTTLISPISHRNLLKIIGLRNGGCQITIRKNKNNNNNNRTSVRRRRCCALPANPPQASEWKTRIKTWSKAGEKARIFAKQQNLQQSQKKR